MPKLYKGPRGGLYHINKYGTKVYMSRCRRRSSSSSRRGCPKGYYKPRGSRVCKRGISAKKGYLSRHGYRDIKHKTKKQRMAALYKAIGAKGSIMSVKQHLNARANLLLRTSPRVSRMMRNDYKDLMKML